MQLVSYVFNHRWDAEWKSNPATIRDVIRPAQTRNDKLDAFNQAHDVMLRNILLNNESPILDFSLNREIVVPEKKSEQSSVWYLRALPLNQRQPIDANYLLALQESISTYRKTTVESSECVNECAFCLPQSESNDLRNSVWFDLDSGTFLTYNKNFCTRIQRHFPDLAKRHVMDYISEASEEIQKLYSASVYSSR